PVTRQDPVHDRIHRSTLLPNRRLCLPVNNGAKGTQTGIAVCRPGVLGLRVLRDYQHHASCRGRVCDGRGAHSGGERHHMTPTQRSLKRLREEGYKPWIVEHWNSFAKIRQDLFGFVDILAVKDKETLGVQTTSYSNISARVKKIKESEYYPILKGAGWRIAAHGWRKVKGRYQVTEREL